MTYLNCLESLEQPLEHDREVQYSEDNEERTHEDVVHFEVEFVFLPLND